MPAHNWRFGASGGVALQKMKWEYERYRTPRLRQAARTLHASGRTAQWTMSRNLKLNEI